jgi:hypothetical protein
LLGEQKVQGLLTVLRDSILQHREALREAIDADDFTEIAPGPPFGGQRRLFGFSCLGRRSEILEQAALENDQSAIGQLAPTFHEYCKHALETLKGLL